LFEDEAAAQEIKNAELEVPVADPAFLRSSLQAKGETVINGMMNANVANMPLMHPRMNTSMQLPQVQQVPTPQCTRNKAPIAEQLTSKLLAVSGKRPVKVWLPPDVAPLKRLDASIPAKKKTFIRRVCFGQEENTRSQHALQKAHAVMAGES
jgi:hypothetical protein